MENVGRIPNHDIFKSTSPGKDYGNKKVASSIFAAMSVLLLATTFMTLSKSFSKKTKLSNQDLKYRKIFLKLWEFNKRSTMLLIFPKIIVFLCFFTSCETPKNISSHFSDVSNPIGAKQVLKVLN